jgi:hypothetical protein
MPKIKGIGQSVRARVFTPLKSNDGVEFNEKRELESPMSLSCLAVVDSGESYCLRESGRSVAVDLILEVSESLLSLCV